MTMIYIGSQLLLTVPLLYHQHQPNQSPYRIPGKSILSQMISIPPPPPPPHTHTHTHTHTHPAVPHWKHHILFLISNPDLSNSCQIISNNCDNSMSYLPHSISSANISIRIVTPISISQHTLYHYLFRLPDINHKQEGRQNATLPQPITPTYSTALNPTQSKTPLILIIRPLN